MAIDNVTSSTQIRRVASGAEPGFNTLQEELYNFTVLDYGGSSIETQPVLANTKIRISEWLSWQRDFQRISVHQNHSLVNFNSFLPVSGSRVLSSLANKLIDEFNLAESNLTKVATQQLGSSTNQGTSSRTGSWNSEIAQIVSYTWGSENLAQIYFNLGSHITFAIDSVQSGPGAWPVLNNTWQALIQSAKSRLVNFKYGHAQWTNPTTTLYANYNGSAMVWSTSSSSSIAVDGTNTIKLIATRTGAVLNIALRLTPLVGPGEQIEVDVSAVFTNVFSRGDVPVSGVFGFAAPQPTVLRIQDLGTAGTDGPPLQTKILRVTPLTMSFSFITGQTSAAQSVTLANDGNTALQVTGINFSNSNGPVSSVPTSLPVFPLTINGGSSVAFNLAYTGNVIGTFNNSFTVVPSGLSSVTVSTQQVVSAVPLDFTVSPSPWEVAINNDTIVSQFFTITPNDGSTVLTSDYSMSLSYSPLAPNPWTLLAEEQGGQRVRFDPTALTSGGDYLATLTVNYKTLPAKTVSIRVTVTMLANQNLGTWRSALQKNNGVVGMSYDIIAGQRYLTIGYGLGADGSPKSATVDNDESFYSLAALSNLGINADSAYSSGPVVYNMGVFETPIGNPFLENYGVWVRNPNYSLDYLGPNSTGVVGFNVTRTYTFTTNNSGAHFWQFSASLGGRFLIDGQLVFDISAAANEMSEVYTGVIDLSAGTHTLTWSVYPGNAAESANGIAVRLTLNGQEVYSTRNSIRTSPAYQYWSEVHRIPINSNGNGQTETIQIGGTSGASRRIKDYQECAGFAYADVFNNFMFRIVNDSFGNLDISFGNMDFSSTNPIWQFVNTTEYSVDIRYFNYLKYHSITDENNLIRLINTTPLPTTAGRTYIFTGFNSNGSLRLSEVNRPVFTTGGGGGGGGGGGIGIEITQVNFLLQQ